MHSYWFKLHHSCTPIGLHSLSKPYDLLTNLVTSTVTTRSCFLAITRWRENCRTRSCTRRVLLWRKTTYPPSELSNLSVGKRIHPNNNIACLAPLHMRLTSTLAWIWTNKPRHSPFWRVAYPIFFAMIAHYTRHTMFA